MKNILVIFTGGTICSAPENGKNESNAKKTESYLISDYKDSDSPLKGEVEFSKRRLNVDILSENMTIDVWSELAGILKEEESKGHAGVIVLHGTDTLAYTSSLLSIMFAGYKVPIFMVSAQLPLRDKDGKKIEESNGYANFRASVELILSGIEPNVYAVYKNSDGKVLLHLGSHLLQCPNYSNDFHSKDETEIPDTKCAKLKGKIFETNERYADKIGKLEENVLLLFPYPNQNYERISLDGVSAVVHGTYHSESACVGRDGVARDEKYSLAPFISRCKAKDIPFFLSPCNEASYAYASTKKVLEAGGKAIKNTTFETAYTKTVVGVSLGLKDEELEAFLNKSINHEFVY